MLDVFTPLLLWLLTLDLLGWLHFPLCFRVAGRLRDRGLALSKLAGAFFPAYVAWVLCHSPIPHTRATLAAVLAAITLFSLYLLRRDGPAIGSFLKRRWRLVLALEMVFWLGGLGAGWIRAQVPAIAFDPNWYGAEKWADYALLSSFMRQTRFPPLDPWLAGFVPNYYYFGHLVWATVAKLTGTPPNIAYNVALAMIVALALTVSVSLGYHLFRRLGLGLLLAFLIVAGGNFKPAAQMIQNRIEGLPAVTRVDFWDCSRAMGWGTRGLIKGSEIHEMPSFSFILGDLHPHFSAHPLFLGFLLVLAALWRASQRRTFSAYEVLTDRLGLWVVLALTVGLLYATNSWDCFVALFLAAATLPFARGFRLWPVRARIVLAVFILGLAYTFAKRAFILPFSTFFTPPNVFRFLVHEWLPPSMDFHSPLQIVPREVRSTVTQWLFYFGLFAGPFGAWQLWALARQTARIPLDRATAHFSVALALGLLAFIHGQTGLVGFLTFGLVFLAPAVFHPRRRDRLELAAILTWLALLASYLCEWFYYDDAFAGPDERINTIFKVYYCLWPVTALGAVGACSALWGGIASPNRLLRRGAACGLMALLLGASSLYPLFAWTTRIRDYRDIPDVGKMPLTLDGLQYLELLPAYADDYRAGLWLREHVPYYSVIAEAPDWGYSAAGRFAAIGGVTSVLGWRQHQTTRRPDADSPQILGREQLLNELFHGDSLASATATILDFNINYVAVGHLERLRYPAEGLAKFGLIGREVFRSGQTAIYSVGMTLLNDWLTSGGQP